MTHSSLTPELFSSAQIEFLADIGVRVVTHLNDDGTQNQSVFNVAANFANGRASALADGMQKLLLDDATKPEKEPPPLDTCKMCNGIGVCVSLPSDSIVPCSECGKRGTRGRNGALCRKVTSR